MMLGETCVMKRHRNNPQANEARKFINEETQNENMDQDEISFNESMEPQAKGKKDGKRGTKTGGKKGIAGTKGDKVSGNADAKPMPKGKMGEKKKGKKAQLKGK